MQVACMRVCGMMPSWGISCDGEEDALSKGCKGCAPRGCWI